MWKKYITRRLAVQVGQSWNFGWGETMEKIYGTSVTNTLIFRDDKKTEYWVDKKQHVKYVNYLYSLLKNEMFLRIFHKEARSTLEMILFRIKNILNKDLTRLSNKQLLDIYKRNILPSVEQFYIRMWTVFNIGGPLSQVIKQKLHEYIDDEEKVVDSLLTLSCPLKPNDVTRKRIDLLQIAQDKSRLEVTRHTNRFSHIPMFDFDHEPYTEDSVLEEIESVDNAKQELKDIYDTMLSNKNNFYKLMTDIGPNQELQLLISFLQENVWLRDYRDMIRQKLNLELRKFYHEVGVRLGLSIDQVAILTNDEIVEHLSKNKQFDKEIIRQRERSFLLIQKGEKVEIYSGKEAMNKATIELDTPNLEDHKEILGSVGSKGLSQGKVRVIYTNKDLDKIEDGDVMVATMTRQDFVPYLRKCKALVTDEGSITCHAAIIARELKIPCVVRTKIATQILKDGDMIEVDANKGMVKKI